MTIMESLLVLEVRCKIYFILEVYNNTCQVR